MMNAINAKLFDEIEALVQQFDVDENAIRAAVRTRYGKRCLKLMKCM